MEQSTRTSRPPIKSPLGNFGNLRFLLIPLILIALVLLSQRFWYYTIVEEQEVGIKFRTGQIYEVVGSGLHWDVGLLPQIRIMSIQAIPFEVTDPEIITKDKQRIGITVSGDIFRPNLSNKELIFANWAEYRGIYLEDGLTISRVQSLTKQAMKVCVGDRNFDASVVGSSRDDLRSCIDDEINQSAEAMGLRVANVAVPEVILSEEVQAALDAIVASRLSTEKAAQDKLRADAESLAEQARQEGEIRVAQSRLQEETRQKVLLAQLEQQRIIAQLSIIEAERTNTLADLETNRQTIDLQKKNDLLAAQRDLEINQALAEAAAAKAQSEVALQTALAELYASNPGYVQLLIAQANASALTETDKIIFTQEGTTPTIVLPGPGISPTVDTTPQQ